MIELKQILCPVDFSDFSRRALDHALGVARCYGSTVTALHVVPPAGVVTPAPYYVGADTAPPVMLPPVDRRLVAQQVERLVSAEQVPGVRVDVLVEEAPDVYREILVQADRLSVDLIVMGVQGRNAADLFIFGSTTHHVVRGAHCAVMTLRAWSHPRGFAPRTPLHALSLAASPARSVRVAHSLALIRVAICEMRSSVPGTFPPNAVGKPRTPEGRLPAG